MTLNDHDENRYRFFLAEFIKFIQCFDILKGSEDLSGTSSRRPPDG